MVKEFLKFYVKNAYEEMKEMLPIILCIFCFLFILFATLLGIECLLKYLVASFSKETIKNVIYLIFNLYIIWTFLELLILMPLRKFKKHKKEMK